jgi:hypothetical protein
LKRLNGVPRSANSKCTVDQLLPLIDGAMRVALNISGRKPKKGGGAFFSFGGRITAEYGETYQYQGVNGTIRVFFRIEHLVNVRLGERMAVVTLKGSSIRVAEDPGGYYPRTPRSKLRRHW